MLVNPPKLMTSICRLKWRRKGGKKKRNRKSKGEGQKGRGQEETEKMKGEARYRKKSF